MRGGLENVFWEEAGLGYHFGKSEGNLTIKSGKEEDKIPLFFHFLSSWPELDLLQHDSPCLDTAIDQLANADVAKPAALLALPLCEKVERRRKNNKQPPC